MASLQSQRSQGRTPRRSALPDFVPFQLAQLVERPPSTAGWLHELKFDGYRGQIRVGAEGPSFRTRRGADWSARFPALMAAVAPLSGTILDGELCAVDVDGLPDFSALQASLSASTSADLVFFAFDILFRDGEDLRARPLLERKAALASCLTDLASARVRYVDHFDADGEALFESACRLKLEGIVSKRANSPYQAGERAPTWRKTKCRPAQDVVIIGWRSDNGRLRSLIAGVREPGGLRYAGRIHTGYNPRNTAGLMERLQDLEIAHSPTRFGSPPRKSAEIHWARPELEAEIELEEFTAAGKIRQGSFKRWREAADRPEAVQAPDPAAPKGRAARRRRAAGGLLGIELAEPEKVVVPGDAGGRPITQRDLAEYVAEVSDDLLSYLRGRPCSILLPPSKPPRGDDFERHAGQGKSPLASAPEVTLTHLEATGKTYFQFDNPAALVAAVAAGAVEFHPWQSLEGRPDLPGRWVLDLDPGDDVGFAAVVEAARTVREVLRTLGLPALLKTTGGKGLHVVVPFSQAPQAEVGWEMSKALCRELCASMVRQDPARFTTSLKKLDRRGRVFLDYLRNGRTNTAAAAWTPRLRPGAPISQPLAWNALKATLDPAQLRIGRRRAAPADWRGVEPFPLSEVAALLRSARG